MYILTSFVAISEKIKSVAELALIEGPKDVDFNLEELIRAHEGTDDEIVATHDLLLAPVPNAATSFQMVVMIAANITRMIEFVISMTAGR